MQRGSGTGGGRRRAAWRVWGPGEAQQRTGVLGWQWLAPERRHEEPALGRRERVGEILHRALAVPEARTNTQRRGGQSCRQHPFLHPSVRPSIPARCEHNPPRACFGVSTRSWFTAYETKGTGVAHLCPASFPPAGIGFPGHTAFPPRRAAPRSPGSISPLIKCQAAAQPCSPSTPKSKLIFLRLRKCTSSLLPALRP